MAEREPTVVVRGAKTKKGQRTATAGKGGASPGSAGAPPPSAASSGASDRGQFGSKIGFIFAAAGSAIGFGSIARFPFMAANNGGAAFVIIYAAIMLLVGVPLIIAEFSVGRSAGLNAVGAFGKLTSNLKTRWRWVGFYFVILAAFFLTWYAVTMGWVLRYIFASFTGAYFDDPVSYFAEAQEGPDALLWFAAAMVLTVLVVARGISGGIEKLNLIMIPALFAIILGLVVYAATLPNVAEGYRFYLSPDWGEVSGTTIKAAVAQAFFSLSLGQGAMLTYASYLSKRQNLATNSLLISGSTLSFAFLAGLMVFPILSSFGLLGGARAGIGLIFVPLPAAFAAIGGVVGASVGILFFVGTFFAAFTSAVSLIEPAVSYLKDELKIPRPKATLLMGELIFGAGIIAALSADVLTLEAGSGTDVGVLTGCLFIAIFVGTVMKGRARQEMDTADGGLKLGFYAYPVVRYVMPFILFILALVALFGNPAIFGLEAGDGFIDELREFFAA